MAGISYTREGRTAYICLGASSRGNSFTPDLRRGLNEALKRYQKDDEAWMAVVHAEGEDFCTGTADVQPQSLKEARERSRLWAGGHVEIWKPLIAAVQGQCRGEGFDLALACDLRVAEESTSFETDFAERQDGPNVSAIWLLNQVGISATLELLWLGKRLDARKAARLGLVNRIVTRGDPELTAPPDQGEGRLPMEPMKQEVVLPQGDALTAAIMLAEELLLYAPVTRTFQKETAYRCIGVPFNYAQSLEVGPNPYASEDRIEGNRAFVERRRPVWRNR